MSDAHSSQYIYLHFIWNVVFQYVRTDAIAVLTYWNTHIASDVPSESPTDRVDEIVQIVRLARGDERPSARLARVHRLIDMTSPGIHDIRLDIAA